MSILRGNSIIEKAEIQYQRLKSSSQEPQDQILPNFEQCILWWAHEEPFVSQTEWLKTAVIINFFLFNQVCF